MKPNVLITCPLRQQGNIIMSNEPSGTKSPEEEPGQVDELVRPKCKTCGIFLPYGGGMCPDCDDIDW